MDEGEGTQKRTSYKALAGEVNKMTVSVGFVPDGDLEVGEGLLAWPQ